VILTVINGYRFIAVELQIGRLAGITHIACSPTAQVLGYSARREDIDVHVHRAVFNEATIARGKI
jgi:hypothetical protein